MPNLREGYPYFLLLLSDPYTILFVMKIAPILFLLLSSSIIHAAKPNTWNLWPGEPPGEVEALPPESDRTKEGDRMVAGKRVTRLQNVSVPTLTIYKPDPKIDTGASVIIAPGGGHVILAMDLEGSEVAEWANSIGMTAIVLKYRVPGRA